MAKLILDATLKRYVWRGTFEERTLARDAGFQWDSDRRYWYTYKIADAYKVRTHAEPHLQAIIDSEYHREENKIQASAALDADVSVPTPTGRKLKPFQRGGVKYLLDIENTPYRGAYLADEMGLGKTVQAIAAMNAIAGIQSVLIVATKSLLINWFREYKRWSTHNLSVGIAEGNFVPETQVVIINYDIVSRNREVIHSRHWDVMICDECHHLKNGEAARSRAIFGGQAVKKKKLEALPPLEVPRAYMLSGTPIEGKPIELWPVIHYLAPTKFPHYWAYAKRYCGAFKGSWGWVVDGASKLDELQRKLRGTIMIRRKKEDVLDELPPKTHQVIELPPSKESSIALSNEMALLADIRQEANDVVLKDLPYREAIQQLKCTVYAAFDEMSALRKETALAKAPAAVDFIVDALAGGHKMVVFAHHRDVVALLREILQGKGVETVSITGQTNAKERDRAVSKFQTDPNVQVFIGNIRAAGVGLTLTAASHVVFVELDWTPGKMAQAEDRCHRIGQRGNVLVQLLILENSLDAHMAKKLVKKQDVSDKTLDGLPELDVILGDEIVNHLISKKESNMLEKLLDLFTRLVVAIEIIAAAVNGKQINVKHPGVDGSVGTADTPDPEPEQEQEPELSLVELIAKAKWDPRKDECPGTVKGVKREILEGLLDEAGIEYKVSATGAELYQMVQDTLVEKDATNSSDDDEGFDMDGLFDEDEGETEEKIEPADFRKRVKAFSEKDESANNPKIKKALVEIGSCKKLSEVPPEKFGAILKFLGA